MSCQKYSPVIGKSAPPTTNKIHAIAKLHKIAKFPKVQTCHIMSISQ